MENETFVLTGKKSNLLIVNISAIVFGFIFIFPFAYISHYGIPFIIFASIVIVLWMALDFFFWNYRGIQQITIDKNNITVFRGKGRKEEQIATSRIKDLIIIEKEGRKTVNIIIDKPGVEVAGIGSFYLGKRIFLTPDAFENLDFELAVCLILEIFESSKVEKQSKEPQQ